MRNPNPCSDPGSAYNLRYERQHPRRLGAVLHADELPAVIRALGVLQDAGAVTEEEARTWRRAIVERRGLPLPEGGAA